MKKALIFQGGWDGHEPALISRRFASILKKNGCEVEITDTLDTLKDAEYLKSLDLIVPCWTMGELPGDYCRNICAAVESGVGLAGCHGGMCDAFRQSTDWQFMTGGQWVAHPGGDGVNYTVNIIKGSDPIADGVEDFDVCSEQYYLHVDPAVKVIATTDFVSEDIDGNEKRVRMPVVWTKYWGKGRVFYNSLGHHDDIFEKHPEAQLLTERGLLWAGNGKD